MILSNSKDRTSTRQLFIVVALVILWYGFAIVTITSSKMILNRASLPNTLCSIQFIFAGVITFFYLQVFSNSGFEGVHSNVRSLVAQTSAGYTIGFILTTSSFSLAPPAFAETVKATEPISTVLIGLLFFSEGTSMKTYATLIPICFGVAMSCIHNTSFHMMAFLLAAGSNFGFSSRAVFAKRLSLFYPDAIDEITLFSAISFLGLILLIPVAFFMEGARLREMLVSGSFASHELLTLLTINGSCFAAYNLLSYIVLKRTDLVTHSVLNCFRRVFIIVTTTLWFNETITFLNSCGVAIAVVGALLFGYSHREDKSKAWTQNGQKGGTQNAKFVTIE